MKVLLMGLLLLAGVAQGVEPLQGVQQLVAWLRPRLDVGSGKGGCGSGVPAANQ